MAPVHENVYVWSKINKKDVVIMNVYDQQVAHVIHAGHLLAISIIAAPLWLGLMCSTS